MNGQMFQEAIGCMLNIMSSIECGAGQTPNSLKKHLLEKNRAMLQGLTNPTYECLSCRSVLKHLVP